jgi:hypothetical protein
MKHEIAHRLALRAALMAALGVASAVKAQRAPTRELGKPAAEFAEPFSGVSMVRELSDGRLLVLDVQDKVVEVVDRAFGSAQAVGREGSGPGEYRMPFQLIAGRADTTLLYDVMNARFLVIGPDGKPGTTISLLSLSGGLPIGPTSVRGVDSRGRLLYQGLNFTLAGGKPTFADSAAIIRYDITSKKADTLAYVHTVAPKMEIGQGSGGSPASVKMGTPAFPVVDEWGLLPDDRLVVLRGRNYALDVIAANGTRSTEIKVPYDPVKVTERDKEDVRKANARAREVARKAMSEAIASSGAPSGTKVPNLQMDDPTDWPDVKPPFAQGALRIAPNGQLWVARLGSAGVKATGYDVLTPAGKLLFQVRVPEKVRIVGFGAHALYTIRVDEDDLQYLQRHPWDFAAGRP